MTRQSIYFTCPACAHRWLGAILHPSDEVTLAALAKQPYCPVCDAQPPMKVEVAEPPQKVMWSVDDTPFGR